MADFNGLYEFNSSSGTIIPDTQSFREKVEAYFKEKFGNDFDLSETSIGGRIVEAFTMFGITVLGVCAQNANILNPQRCFGNMLDNLASIFGVNRGTMNDSQLRENLMKGLYAGNGFEMKIDRAIRNVSGVDSVVLLVNRYADNAVYPKDGRGITVSPNSIYVSVHGGNDREIAQAILDNASLKCGMAESLDGTRVDVDFENEYDVYDSITFYRPIDINISVKVKTSKIYNEDIDKVESAINEFLSSKKCCSIITVPEIASIVGQFGFLKECVFSGDRVYNNEIVIGPQHYATFTLEIENDYV